MRERKAFGVCNGDRYTHIFGSKVRPKRETRVHEDYESHVVNKNKGLLELPYIWNYLGNNQSQIYHCVKGVNAKE